MKLEKQREQVDSAKTIFGTEECPKCGPTQAELRNHSIMWGDGEVHCVKCGTLIRYWNSG